VLQNKEQGQILGPNRYEATGCWRKLHNQELHNLYFSPNIRMVELRMTRWVGYMTCHRQKINSHKFTHESLKKWKCLQPLGVGGRLLLRLSLKKLDWRLWTGLIWLGIRTKGGLL
jgi:hypothetical protein